MCFGEAENRIFLDEEMKIQPVSCLELQLIGQLLWSISLYHEIYGSLFWLFIFKFLDFPPGLSNRLGL